MKSLYISLLLLLCPQAFAMENKESLQHFKKQRVPWIKQLNGINNQIKNATNNIEKLTDLVSKKVDLLKQKLKQSYNSELLQTAQTNKRRISYLKSRIKYCDDEIKKIESEKSMPSQDLTQSTVCRYGLKCHKKERLKLIQQLSENSLNTIQLRKRLEQNNELEKSKLSQTDKNTIDQLVLGQSSKQRKKWINRYKTIHSKLKSTSDFDQSMAREEFLDIYNEALYLLFQIIDNYAREQENITDDTSEPVVTHWEEELEEIGAMREKLLNPKLDTHNEKFGLNSLSTIKEGTEKENNLITQEESEQTNTTGLMSKLFGWLFWKK